MCHSLKSRNSASIKLELALPSVLQVFDQLVVAVDLLVVNMDCSSDDDCWRSFPKLPTIVQSDSRLVKFEDYVNNSRLFKYKQAITSFNVRYL